MTVTRTSYTSLSGVFSGGDLVDDLASKVGCFFDNMSLIPVSITNTGNDYTITIDPALNVGDDVTAGMSFHIVPNTDNTGTARLRVTNSGSYYAIKKADGKNLSAGDFNQQTTYHVLFINGEWRILNSSAVSTQYGLVNEQVFTSSGTWTKPSDMPTSAVVEVFVWGGGGGGGNNSLSGSSGGGGGACAFKTYKIGDLASTVSVTVGAGGNANSAGGNSSFGSLLLAYGGGRGWTNASGASGGGGGGLTSAGGAGDTSLPGGNGGSGGGGGQDGRAGTGSGAQLGGFAYGGGGGGGGYGGTTSGAGGSAVIGGGGGGASYPSVPGIGGGSVFGGGGGAGAGGTAAGGVSMQGGNGGNYNTAPTVPGGGGGGASSSTYYTGASGQCRVRVYI